MCGSGFYYKIISGFASFALSTVFSGVGGITWVGSGSLKYIHVTRTSNSLTAATVRARDQQPPPSLPSAILYLSLCWTGCSRF